MNTLHDDRLSTQEHWDTGYQAQRQTPAAPDRGKRLLRSLLGDTFVSYFKDYDEWLAMELLYREYLPQGKGLRLMEIGSAPGTHLVALHEKYGYEPYGVEYSPAGVEVNRRNFAAHGLKAERVIEADAFDPAFIAEYRESFDIVLSRGLIEHFQKPQDLVNVHLGLLKPGGTLWIEVPNFRGFYYPWFRFCRPDVMTWHNFEVMKARVFRGLFDPEQVQTRYCGYYGIISFSMFIPPKRAPLKYVGRALRACQTPLNPLLRLCFGKYRPESALLSPHLLFVGTKK